MRNERGMAMLIALIVAILLSLLCLSLTFSSMKEFQVSTEFENHEKALLVADAGFNAVKQSLRGKEIDTFLARATDTYPQIDPSNTLQPWAIRNPISPYQARNINFSSTSWGGTPVAMKGLITSGTGERIGDCTNGKPCGIYFARITDNNDGDGKPEEDADGTLFLRVVGVSTGSRSDVAGSKNSVAVIESMIHRETTFDMTAPFSIISRGAAAQFNGNSLKVDGYDHSGMTLQEINSHKDDGLTPFSAISCLYDNPGLGDATATRNNILTALAADNKNQADNIYGKGGYPSVYDDTLSVKGSSPDSDNIFNPNYLLRVAMQAAGVADYSFPTGTDTSTKFSGGEVFGTPANPKVTYVKGDLDIQGSAKGAGLLVVTGNMTGNGGFDFEGLVLVLGSGTVTFGGANKTIVGGIVVAKLTPGSPAAFDTASMSISGKSEFYFAGDKIRLATSLLPMRALSWREITPEIEPVASSTTP